MGHSFMEKFIKNKVFCSLLCETCHMACVYIYVDAVCSYLYEHTHNFVHQKLLFLKKTNQLS